MTVKAGGMRIVTKHKHKEQDADAFDEKYKDSVNPIGGPPVKWVDMAWKLKPTSYLLQQWLFPITAHALSAVITHTAVSSLLSCVMIS